MSGETFKKQQPKLVSKKQNTRNAGKLTQKDKMIWYRMKQSLDSVRETQLQVFTRWETDQEDEDQHKILST